MNGEATGVLFSCSCRLSASSSRDCFSIVPLLFHPRSGGCSHIPVLQAWLTFRSKSLGPSDRYGTAMKSITNKAAKAHSPIMDTVCRYALWALVFVLVAEIAVAVMVW